MNNKDHIDGVPRSLILRMFVISAALFFHCFSVCAIAQVSAKEQTISFDIPPQELRTALDALIDQTDMSIIYNLADVGTVITHRVTGSYTPTRALSIMLEGTGLVFEVTGQKSVAIRKERPQVARPLETDHSKRETSDLAGVGSESNPEVKISAPFTLEELVVTAQKRTERLQETTVSASVLADSELTDANAADISDMNSIVPSVQIKGTLNGRVPMAIRGISTNALMSNIGLPMGVSILVDGVPVPTDSMGVNELEDIQHVEVLKGPQSTLGGRTASAGVINFVTRAPRDHFGGSAGLVWTDDNEKRLDAFLTGPVGNKFSFSVSGMANERQYLNRNLYDGNHSNSKGKSIRAKLAYWPNDALSLLLTGHAARYESHGADLVYKYLPEGAKLFPFTAEGGISQEELFPGIDIGFSNTDYNSPVNGVGADIKDHDISLKADCRIGRYTLSSITSSFKENRKNLQDVPLVSDYFWQVAAPSEPAWYNHQVLRTEVESFNQEFKIASPVEDPIDFVAGLFYSRVKAHQYYFRDWSLNPTDRDHFVTTSTYAAYGRVSWRLNDSMDLITGLRINFDEMSFKSIQRRSNLQAPGVVLSPPKASDTSTALVGDITLKRNVGRYSMLYGTYARGYKPSVYSTNTTLSSNEPIGEPVGQEHINHFELGGKFTWLKGNLIVNVAAFDTIYEDYQIQIQDTSKIAGIYELKATGEAETRGFELDLTTVPTQDLKLSVSAAYIDARFNDFPNAFAWPQQTDEEGAYTAPDGTTRLQDLSGKPMPNSPKFKGTLSVEQRIPQIALPFDVILGGRYSYSTKTLMQANQNPETEQPDFGVLNLSIKGVSLSGKYSLTFFVNNVFDKFYQANMEDFWSPLYDANAVVGFSARDARRYAGLRLTVTL